MASTPRYQSQDVSVEPLSQPLHFEFSDKTASNRFLKASMAESLASWDPKNPPVRGIPSQGLINLYRRWGEAKYGMIVTGNIMTELDHLTGAGTTIVPRGCKFEGERFEAFKALAEASKKHGSLIIGQSSHPGRQVPSIIQKNPVSASDVQLEGNILGMTYEKPHAATLEDIEHIIEGFAHMADFLCKAGFDGIELHGAHGYLLAQFLAQSTNKRNDKYGGSLENRSRLLIEIVQAIRKRVPSSFILGFKINSVEFQAGGFDTAECRDLCATLEANHVDFVELSGGTYQELAFKHTRESTRKRESFFLEFAEAIVPAFTKTKTFVTGGFKTVGAMVNALKTVDGVGLARITCQEPRFCADVLDGKITGAIKQGIEEDNFQVSFVAAGSLIGMIAKDQEPADLSREEIVGGFMQDMEAWAEWIAKDSELQRYGYVDMKSVKPNPYGIAY